ncbi:MAG: hypothetical protein ACLR2E_06965 [Lachnospiraceae bacterium]
MSGVWLPAFKSLMKKSGYLLSFWGLVMLRYQQPGETTLLWKILYDRAVTLSDCGEQKDAPVAVGTSG